MKATALQRGTAVHEAIEYYNTGKSWKRAVKKFAKEFYRTTMKQEIEAFGDVPKIVQSICENYFECYGDDGLEYLDCEVHFELPLSPTINLEGYIDAITKDGNEIWPMEHKTYKRMPNRDFIMFNPQAARYIWALWQLGYKPAGFLWNILLVAEPALPTLTEKTHELSLKKIKSTPYTIIQGIKQLGLDPKNYQEYISKFSYDDFFYRSKIRLSEDVVNDIMKDTIKIAEDIDYNGEKNRVKNLTKDCSWCSYKSICQGEMMGLDVDYIKKSEYKKREHGRNEEQTHQPKIRIKTHRNRGKNKRPHRN